MQTAELVAGRELDALVAEKVMGWRKRPMDTHLGRITLIRNPATGAVAPPDYSTDIAAAWQVVEKIGLAVVPDGSGWVAAQAGIRDLGISFDGTEWAEADTAPLAICRAALAAVGHHDEKSLGSPAP